MYYETFGRRKIHRNEDDIVKEKRTRVYTYTRVSTAMQIDGYSLDAQKSRIKAFADYNDYEIVREYEELFLDES